MQLYYYDFLKNPPLNIKFRVLQLDIIWIFNSNNKILKKYILHLPSKKTPTNQHRQRKSLVTDRYKNALILG